MSVKWSVSLTESLKLDAGSLCVRSGHLYSKAVAVSLTSDNQKKWKKFYSNDDADKNIFQWPNLLERPSDCNATYERPEPEQDCLQEAG